MRNPHKTNRKEEGGKGTAFQLWWGSGGLVSIGEEGRLVGPKWRLSCFKGTRDCDGIGYKSLRDHLLVTCLRSNVHQDPHQDPMIGRFRICSACERQPRSILRRPESGHMVLRKLVTFHVVQIEGQRRPLLLGRGRDSRGFHHLFCLSVTRLGALLAPTSMARVSIEWQPII